METLRDIGLRNDADKVHSSCAFGGEDFLDVYGRLFPKREYPIRLLELGVRQGNSIRTWEEYWPGGTIIGIDIDEGCAGIRFNRAHILIGKQDDPKLLAQACEIAEGEFDVILDDASHVTECTLASFAHLYPHVKSRGYYVIEDTSCTYIKELKAGMIWGRWFKPEMEYVRLSNDRRIFDEWLLRIVEDMDHKRGDVLSVTNRNELCILQKV